MLLAFVSNLNVTPGYLDSKYDFKVLMVLLALPIVSWDSLIATLYVLASPLLSEIVIDVPLTTLEPAFLFWDKAISLAVLLE